MRTFSATCLLVSVALASSARGQTPDELVKRLKDPDATARRLAAEGLGKQKVVEAIPALAEALTDRQEGVRRAAGLALTGFGAKAVPALVAALAASDEESRLAALGVLANLKEEAKDARGAIQKALKDPATDVRIHAAHALGQQGATAQDALPALYEAAKDTANLGTSIRSTLPGSVSEAAIDAALKIDPRCAEPLAKVALPSLIAGLKSKDEGVLQGAVFAVAKLGPHAKPALGALEDARKHARGFAEDGITRAIAGLGGDTLKPLLDAVRDTAAPLDKRLRALSRIALSSVPDDRIAPALLAALKDNEPPVRAGAVYAISLRKVTSKEIVAALLERLGDAKLEAAAEEHQRPTPAVAYALSRFGANAVPGLAEVLKDPKNKPLARWHAAKALALVGRKARPALPVLEQGLTDRVLPIAIESACAYVLAGGDVAKSLPVLSEGLSHKAEFVLASSAHAIERLGGQAKSTAPRLIELLGHSEREVRIAAARALAGMGADAKPAVTAMAKRARDGDPRERYQFGAALEALGPEAADAVPVLIDCLKDLGNSSHSSTLVTLGNIGPAAKAAVPALIAVLEKNKGDLHEQGILDTLGRIGPDADAAVPKLAERLADKSQFTRADAARALGRIGPNAKAATPRLRDLAADEADAVRVWAAFALARIGDGKGQIPLLIELWKKEGLPGGGSTRFYAAQAFELLGPDAVAARDVLLDALADRNTPLGSHAHIARALGRMPREAAVTVPKLIAVLERPRESDFNAYFVAHAVDALGQLGPKAKDALPRLRKLLDDENQTLAEAAEKAIRSIEGK